MKVNCKNSYLKSESTASRKTKRRKQVSASGEHSSMGRKEPDIISVGLAGVLAARKAMDTLSSSSNEANKWKQS